MKLDPSLLSAYNWKNVEEKIYKEWEDSGYFNPDNLPAENILKEKIIDGNGKEIDKEKTFTIIMPPPNANGSLHAGHALFVTIEDILIRYKRMNGFRALWLPGADHAGFETQVVYEKNLEKEGKSRFDFSHDELYQKIMDFTLHNKSFMEGQIRQLGASCDWSRELFTLDTKIIKTVNNTFERLNNDGLIYRGKRIISWCPKHQTSLSNLETEYKNRKDPFYYFKYGPFTIGTVRPETKFGDKYVVVHPDDERYKKYFHNQKIKVEWINGEIEATVIKDESINMEVGSGAMTITPWHSAVDFEIAKKYNLEMEQIIDERGKLLPIAEEFSGMNIKEAREKIVEKLKAKDLLVKVDENYEHEVPVCYKCERELEPQIKNQWFIKMEPLAKKALEVIKNNETKILTEEHKKVFNHWLTNIQDWNISRQIVWGIKIPAKLCVSCDAGYVDIENKLTKCTECNSNLVLDTDCFDTWFSSGQWPFATLQNTKENDFEKFYPTSVMETGFDILFFWVARMMMLGIYITGKSPFKDIYLHGLVRDTKGKKMSKSKGNVISPLEVSNEYGTDALRMGLIVNNAPGADMNLDTQKIKAYKNFANKVWNATRFVIEKCESMKEIELNLEDKNIYNSWREKSTDITNEIEKYNLHIASEKIYDYFWKEFCDKIIEEKKNIIQNVNDRIERGEIVSEEEMENKNSAQTLIAKLLREQIITLHPFMPFLTEEIWKFIKKDNDNLLLVTNWIK